MTPPAMGIRKRITQAFAERRRRMSKWLVFGVVFALVPVSFDAVVLDATGSDVSPPALLGEGIAFILGFGITSNALGELIFEKEQNGPQGAGYIACIVVSTVMLAFGALYYGLAGTALVGDISGYVYLASSVGVGLATVWASR